MSLREMADEALVELTQRGGTHRNDGLAKSGVVGYLPGQPRFIKGWILEAHREAGDLVAHTQPRRKGSNQPTVNPTRQEEPDRHVASNTKSRGVDKQLEQGIVLIIGETIRIA